MRVASNLFVLWLIRFTMTATKTTTKTTTTMGKPTAPSIATMNDTETTTIISTRVCIKNLPLNYTSQDLRQFLLKGMQSQSVQLTDCRVLTQRKMAFCGFANSQQAAQCVERFHKTYCKTSKLVVELALAPAAQKEKQTLLADSKAAKSSKQALPLDGSTSSTAADDEAKLQKKEAFLATLNAGGGTTTRRKFWANDDEDGGVAPVPVPAAVKEAAASAAAADSDSESSIDSGSDSDSDDDSVVDPLEKKSVVAAPQSDMDFLRSKQVSVEDLSNVPVQPESAVENENETETETTTSSNKKNAALDDTVEEPARASEKKHNDQEQEEPPQDEEEEEGAVAPNRLFCRNLPFSCTDDDLRQRFSDFGTVEECHVPVDDTGRSKGFAFVTFQKSSDAASAKAALDETDFQGRLLHILPARRAPASKDNGGDSGNAVGDSYKDQQEQKRRETAATTTTGWSASFVRGDAVIDNLAARLGLRKGDILAVKDGLSSGDAAVRMALGETAVIEENRTYFAQHGVDMEALVSLGGADDDKNKKDILRSKSSILVKNLPHDTNKEDLMKVFATSGKTPTDILLPPSKTIAVVKYSVANDAKVAFARLAYRRFKSVPLYLEWAPLSAQVENNSSKSVATETVNLPDAKGAAAEEEEAEDALMAGPTSTLYVKNLNFVTTEEQLRVLFAKHASDVRNIRIPQKVAAMKRVRKAAGDSSPGEMHSVSMGYGFVEFGSQESVRKVLKALQGTMLDGHLLELKPSNKGPESQGEASNIKAGKNSTKLMVRNVPFQATRSELLKLFGSFGQLKKIRVPKKFDGTHRGFAFVEYLTGKEAAAAMKSLSRTHLYGRHLVLEWAANDEETDDLQGLRDKAQRDQESLAAPKNKKIRFE
jgi:multiple RNA-binding domain-containing protein 1